MEFENVLPSEIEKRRFKIIESELPHDIEKTIKPIVKRVIHTTADFDYLDNLCFSENVVEIIKNAIKNGADIVTDTQMARSGINKKRLASYGGEVHCFMSDEDVAKTAERVIVMNDGHVEMQGTVAEVFAQAEHLQKIGLNVPQVTLLTDKLRLAGYDLPEHIYTVKYAADAIKKLIGGGGNV